MPWWLAHCNCPCESILPAAVAPEATHPWRSIGTSWEKGVDENESEWWKGIQGCNVCDTGAHTKQLKGWHGLCTHCMIFRNWKPVERAWYLFQEIAWLLLLHCCHLGSSPFHFPLSRTCVWVIRKYFNIDRIHPSGVKWSRLLLQQTRLLVLVQPYT